MKDSFGSGEGNPEPDTRTEVLGIMREDERDPHSFSVVSIKNFRSPACQDLNRDADFARGRVAAGDAVSELDIYEHSISRYRRSNSRKALRVVHRIYPAHTRMILKDGIWYLEPITGRK